MFLNLKEDGEEVILLLLGEPQPRVSVYQGKERSQAVFPVLTPDGVKVWAAGARVYRKLKEGWSEYSLNAVKVTRHGEANSQATTYELKTVKRPAGLAKMLTKAVHKEAAEALESAVNYGGNDSGASQPF
jgi:hypothetical protein